MLQRAFGVRCSVVCVHLEPGGEDNKKAFSTTDNRRLLKIRTKTKRNKNRGKSKGKKYVRACVRACVRVCVCVCIRELEA